MNHHSVRFGRRQVLAAGLVLLLAGCQSTPRPLAPPPGPQVEEAPPVSSLPEDQRRHRVALLVPLSGPNAEVGQSIANAAAMALLDTSADNLRITNYDTGTGAGSAAAKAVADGNRLILGPLTASEIPAVAQAAARARTTVPVISYSNDAAAADARGSVFVMGSVPSQSIARSVNYAWGQGARRFAALVPGGEYGQRAAAALGHAARAKGAPAPAVESYDRARGSILAAARRLKDQGGHDTVLLADSVRLAAQAAVAVKVGTAPRLIGTDLWSGEALLGTTPALRGALFAAVPDHRWRQFADSYRRRFGSQPHRIATLGYDSVLLALRVAREWQLNTPFPLARLRTNEGFLGLDGPFRFAPDGVVERAFEVREVRAGGVTVVDPAPTRFGD